MSAFERPGTLGDGRPGFADRRDVDLFVDMLERFEEGAVTPDEWRAFRLVNGVYGQRQDGQMMIRTKIPQGILTPDQLEAVAEVADRWGEGKAHVTTRQNFQIHFVGMADAEAALRRLADAGITTREACGNSVRNITGCPYAGTVPGEAFDPTPFAEALTRHLLRGPYSARLPRKFKIAVGGCCGTDDVGAAFNDLGFLAHRDADGRPAFRVLCGGGLATLRRSGFVLHEALPPGEILAVADAVVRVFDRVGDRNNRNKARLKWAIDKLGVETFRAAYQAERAALAATGGQHLDLRVGEPTTDDVAPARARGGVPGDGVRLQKQAGFASVTLRLPLGDVTGEQLRGLAALARRFGEGPVRVTNEQNLVFRFVSVPEVSVLLASVGRLGLPLGGAATVVDVTSCPGAWSCKLAVTGSRGLAATLGAHLEARPALAALAPDLNIKISGCPNGCGQHYVGGIGLQGGMRKVGGRPVPQYLVYLGGGPDAARAHFGRLVAKVPARRVTTLVERLLGLYAAARQPGEAPDAFFRRVPTAQVAPLVEDLAALDESSVTPEDYVDLGETTPFEVSLGEGECAA